MLRVTASLCLSFPDTIALPLPEQVLRRDPFGVSQCQAYLLLRHACARRRRTSVQTTERGWRRGG